MRIEFNRWFDSAYDKRFEKAAENLKAKWGKESKEKKSYEQMTDAEKAEYNFNQKQEKLNQREQKVTVKENRGNITNKLAEDGLPVSLTKAFTANKGWVAAYPSISTGTRCSTNNSWQWGSDFKFWGMGGRNFDVSQNYSDKYYHTGTSNASQPAQAITNGTASATTSALSAGDTVYIKTAAGKYYGSNTEIPKFVKNKNYHVLSVSGN